MSDTGIAVLLLVGVNIVFSWKGLKHTAFFDGYKFEVDKILVKKDYQRLVTSGFLHVSWMHLIFNMYSLFLFSSSVAAYLGSVKFLVIYFASLLGGGLLSLYIHRNEANYSAVGASGAVCGVIFASVALFPQMEIGLILIPVYFPAWIYGIVFVAYSIYGIRSRKDNIGHDAHLGGALIGMMVALAMQPGALKENLPTILLILVPTIAFILFIALKPGALLVDNFFYNTHHDHYSIDHRYNEQKNREQKEVDRILDKIHRRGIQSLSKTEKEMLDAYSRKNR